MTRDQLVDAAIQILDAKGEDGLTFRTLSERLATGPGSIYWHIENRAELLRAACDVVIAQALREIQPDEVADSTLRALALDVFEALDSHPWIGSSRVRAQPQSPMLPVLERIGQCVVAMGVPAVYQWATAGALYNYIIGVGGQNAANGQYARANGLDRTEFLAATSTLWSQLDRVKHPFLSSVARDLRIHDDREDFLAGFDLILAGIESLKRRPPSDE